jgi:GTPase SAR1 family protein
MARVYYKNSYGALLVYDISRPITFETVSKWKDEIDNRVLLPNGKHIPVVLLGNKSDLDNADIDERQLDNYCLNKGFVGWFDTSAKLNHNIDEACNFLVEKILSHRDIFSSNNLYKDDEQNYSPGFIPGRDNKNKGMKLDDKDGSSGPSGGSGCC